ncbi:MAG TPA: TRAP transporter large permease subunit [Afifellaceae bacterium]|nr:TRAP transporter large permease subunit [Afifellaceae bacterium]
MTDPQIAVLMLGIFILTIFLGFPICFTLMAMGVAFGYYAYFEPDRMWRSYHRAVENDADTWTLAETWFEGLFNNQIFDLFVNQTYSVMANDVLTAVPLFLFMGYIVERANIVNRLFDTLYVSAKRMPGAMAVAALATCALFATATGIIGAVVTLMGMLALPSMMRANYNISFASGVICAGGCLGILIPPSIMLIVYAAASNVSIVRLYAGAIFPGFMLAGLYMVYVVGRAWLNPALAPKPPADETDEYSGWQIAFMLMTSFFPLAFLILSVLGAILAGWATPSEAASVGALGGLALAAAYRALTWQRLKESVYLTVRTSAMVCWLFVGSWTFASVFSYLGGHDVIEQWVLGMNLETWQFLVMAQLIIFFLGWPLEWSEILIIFVPIFLPMLDTFHVNPYFFAMLVALNLQTSFLTPPMAMSAYYLKGVLRKQIELFQIFRGIMPYLAIVIFSMFLMYQFPGIALWLPDYLFGVYQP